MNCEEARPLFSARADERLTSEERANLATHLTVCAVCPGEWERFLETVIRLRSVEEPQLSSDFTRRVIAMVSRKPLNGRRLPALFSLPHLKLVIGTIEREPLVKVGRGDVSGGGSDGPQGS